LTLPCGGPRLDFREKIKVLWYTEKGYKSIQLFTLSSNISLISIKIEYNGAKSR